MKKFLTCLLVGFVCLVTLSAQTHEKKIYNDGVIDYVPAGAKIRLIPIDTELDIEKILYRLDSGPETEFTDLIPLVEEGRHVLAHDGIHPAVLTGAVIHGPALRDAGRGEPQDFLIVWG